MKIDWERTSIAELAALVMKKLREKGIDALLVGGAFVSIYIENNYYYSDFDFVSHASIHNEQMTEL